MSCRSKDEGSRWLLPLYESWATPKQCVQQVLAGVLEQVQPPDDARISTQVCPGSAAKVLVDAAAAADMIVVGYNGAGAALSGLLGFGQPERLLPATRACRWSWSTIMTTARCPADGLRVRQGVGASQAWAMGWVAARAK